MSKKIIIKPVTRIEGHGKVSIQLDEQGNAINSKFIVEEFRGFEKFCEGRMLWEMPLITSRICGICPVSHHLTAVKAIENVLNVQVPPQAELLRRLMHMAQFIHNHALHFFYLSMPDLLFSPDGDPKDRNFFGVMASAPELAQKAIRLRQIGQNIVHRVGGRSIHPVTAIPGGMSKPLTHEERFESSKEIDEALALVELALDTCKTLFEEHGELLTKLGSVDKNYLGLVKEGSLELYDGMLHLVNGNGVLVKQFAGEDYLDYIDEYSTNDTYSKFPYYKELNYDKGTYQVGPLARLNIVGQVNTPLANKELQNFKAFAEGYSVNQTMYYHYARMIELLYAVEHAKQLLDEDAIVSKDVRVSVNRAGGKGSGVIEAPRGTLMHHYQADDTGKIIKADIIVPTTHNNAAINESVNQAARTFIKGGEVAEGLLNRVEMAIRCYDPCLSCSTHQIGMMPLIINIRSADGELVSSIRRDG
ncbi:Ni/Fe hydrogenase subunit alpha [Metallumcola ferriviriculae]|uniref:Ni/Fe hydrogenase subunit alpha n=1 Tax=Metallumcola ferriviriculae TaxID=3039180 RepID=A0AAU0UJ72_9FIRM|nr:Ni/Fe hydrogenase subunit alpha [Desulfitibacteraceae bacterium MK1]